MLDFSFDCEGILNAVSETEYVAPRDFYPRGTEILRNFFGECPQHSEVFRSLTETPIRNLDRQGGAVCAISQLAYSSTKFVSVINNEERVEIHASDLLPACSALVRELTGKNISGFKKFSVKQQVHSELDLIAYEGNFKYQDFANGRKVTFRGHFESDGRTIHIIGYQRDDKILNVVYSASDIDFATERIEKKIDGRLFKFSSVHIPENLFPKELLERNMPYVVASLAFNFGGEFLYKTDFSKHFSKHFSKYFYAENGFAPFIHSFKDCELPPSNFFNGDVVFTGEVDIDKILPTDSGNILLPCEFKITNESKFFEYKISIDLVLVRI